jgi:hypothetical protein
MLSKLKNLTFEQKILILMAFFLCMVLFSISYQNRIRIYNWVLYLNEGPAFYDYGRFNDTPYGFEEDQDLALFSFKSALNELAEHSLDLYFPEKEAKGLSNEHRSLKISWERHLSNKGLLAITMFLRDMSFFCKDVRSYETEMDKFERDKRLKKRYKVSGTKEKTKPFVYALKKGDYSDHRQLLIDLKGTYLERALRRKPDAISVINLVESVDHALCEKFSSIGYWNTALDYLEYRAEGQVYNIIKDKNTPLRNELIEYRSWQRLRASKAYSSLLKEYFFRIKQIPGNEFLLLRTSRKFYTLTKEEEFLLGIFENSVKAYRYQKYESNAEVFEKLMKITENLGLLKKPFFTILLAETAYTAGDMTTIKELLAILKSIPETEKIIDRSRIERLSLLVEMHLDNSIPTNIPKAGAPESNEL